MKTIEELRREFEKMPNIASIINGHEAHYCKNGNWWICSDDNQFAEVYLDGAWFMFQELNK